MEENSRYLEFVEEDKYVCGPDKYIIIFPIKNHGEDNQIQLWVAYELGGKHSYGDGKWIARGFYLYISANCGSSETFGHGHHHQRVLVMEVPRKTQRAYKKASRKAGRYARDIVESLCPDLDIDWNRGKARGWGGYGNRVGMWSMMYRLEEYDFPEEDDEYYDE